LGEKKEKTPREKEVRKPGGLLKYVSYITRGPIYIDFMKNALSRTISLHTSLVIFTVKVKGE
jgi:hypothetical protein